MPFSDITEDKHDSNHARVDTKNEGRAIVDMELGLILADKNSVVGETHDLAGKPDLLHRAFDHRAGALITNDKDL